MEQRFIDWALENEAVIRFQSRIKNPFDDPGNSVHIAVGDEETTYPLPSFGETVTPEVINDRLWQALLHHQAAMGKREERENAARFAEMMKSEG